MTKVSDNTKERILDAAATVVLRDSPVGLTLEQVAKEAGVSKGGLLYHFRSKDALLQGIIERIMTDFETSTMERVSKDPVATGRFLRAYIYEAAAPPEQGSAHEKRKKLQKALMAVIAINPGLLDPLREGYKIYRKLVESDGLEPVTANIVWAAADAIWLASINGIPVISEDMRDRILERIISFTYGKEDMNA